MQGAALKLTALAASLAVGFVVLVQTQQSLTARKTGELAAFDEAPGFDSDVHSSADPDCELESGEETAPDLIATDLGQSQSNPLNTASAETELQPVPERDPFSAVPPQTDEPELAAFRRDSAGGEPTNPPAQPAAHNPPTQPAEHDPFAMFARQAADQFAKDVAERAEPVVQVAAEAVQQLDEGVKHAQGETQAAVNGIQQVAHEAAVDIPQSLKPVPEQALPVLQAVAGELEERSGVSFPGLNNDAASPRPNQTKEMRLELAQRFPSEDDSDPFAMKPPKAASKPKSEAKPEPNDKVEPPAFGGFPQAEPQPEPEAVTAEKPMPAEPAKIPGGFPKAEPAPLNPVNSRPAGFPQFGVSAPEKAPEMSTEADEADAKPIEIPAEEMKPGNPPPAFFGEFSGEQKTGSEDDPYRLVPEFNGKPEAGTANREPAPFQFGSDPAEETNEAVSSAPDSAMPSVPATPNPFGSAPQLPAETPKAMPEPGGFPALGAPAVAAPEAPKASEEMPAEIQPEPANSTPPAQPSFDTFSTNDSAPLSVPMAQDQPEPPMVEGQPEPEAQPRPEPGGFPGFPGTPEMSQEKTPAAEPAPLANTDEKPVAEPEPAPAKPLDDEELLGSAYVDGDQIESVQQPKVELYKSAPENAVLGEPLIYSIEVVNTGDVAVREVRVEDQFPAGTKLTGTIPRAELVEKTLLWNFEELKPEERKKILVRVVPVEPGTIGSISTVSYKSVVAAQTVVTAPRLELSLATSQKEVAIGESVEVTFVVANTGKGDAHGVILRNLIPVGLEHPAGADLEYEIGTLKGGEQKEITLAMLAKQAGDFTNEASLKSKGGVSAAGEATIRIIPAVMSLTQNGPTRRFVGHAADYEATVKNNSQRTLAQLTVSQVVPNGMEFRSASAGGTFDPVRRTVTWRVGTLPAGEVASLQTKLVPRQMGMQELKLEAREAGGSFAELDLPVKVEGMASLAVRVPEERGPVSKGERVSLKFKVVNRGSAPAENVMVNCRVPSQLKYLSAKGASEPQATATGVQFTSIPKLAANQEMVFDLVFTAEGEGDARVEFEVTAGGLTSPLKHQEQIIVYGD